MTDHLEAARDRLGGLHDHLSRREVALAADDLHAILSAILDHLEAQQTVADPLDESNHDDRIDRYGERWVWCDGCNGFRPYFHGMHESGCGFTAAGLDEHYGPLTFAPCQSATTAGSDTSQESATVADPLDEDNHADRIDRDGDRWVWCDRCDGFRLGARHEVHKSGYGWSAYGVNEACGPLTFAPRQ